MTDQMIYRIAGISSLATMAIFFIEFPFYLHFPEQEWRLS
jgi:hypothetical protein